MMSFNWLLFLEKSSAMVVWHNPKYASDIPLNTPLDCLELTYQIFRTPIFQDASKDLILSYDLISLFPSI